MQLQKPVCKKCTCFHFKVENWCLEKANKVTSKASKAIKYRREISNFVHMGTIITCSRIGL